MANLGGLFKNEREVERRAAGSTILEVGAPATHMYVVRSGRIAIRVGTLTVETVGEGGLVGEMALVDDRTRSASVVALTDCELIPIDQKRFLFLVRETPFFALEVMRTMADRLRTMNERASHEAKG
jgi:CRP-like cAMP-binding protein